MTTNIYNHKEKQHNYRETKNDHKEMLKNYKKKQNNHKVLLLCYREMMGPFMYLCPGAQCLIIRPCLKV